MGTYRVCQKKGILYELEDLHGAKLTGFFHPIKMVKVNQEKRHHALESLEETKKQQG